MPPPKPSQSRKKTKTAQRSTLVLDSPPPAGPPAKKQRTSKPLASILKPPIFELTGSPELKSQGQNDVKGKGRETLKGPHSATSDPDDRMWVDIYEPQTEEHLAVHKRKVQDVRQWLLEAFDGGPSGKLRKYRRILVLTGPAGTAKTATIRVLARELSIEILEWRNSRDDVFSRNLESHEQVEYEGLSDKFHAFLARATSYRSVFAGTDIPTSQGTQSSMPASLTRSMNHSGGQRARQIVLLEDMPNILHPGTQTSFHSALDAFVVRPAAGSAPLVMIVSDAGVRGEGGEDPGSSSMRRAKEVFDVRSVLPPHLLTSPYVTQVSFNPIAPTFLRRALQNLMKLHFSRHSGAQPSKEVLDLVVESANGDIRSAIMALQFACLGDGRVATGKKTKGSRKDGTGNARAVLEAVTRREQSLALFHLLGKLMYNKRKGDPPNASASAKDIQREKDLDAQIRDPPPLPVYISEHERRASRVDVEMLYADSPVDASLLSLYVHQNYAQYCDTLEQCDAEADMLSWIDFSGGETWYQANPHRFHLLALGTLHALPSPVPRRNQKQYKPAFFEALRREREAENAVRDVQAWLQHHETSFRWSQKEIALELGAMLKVNEFGAHAPSTHRRFSMLNFMTDLTGQVQLADDNEVVQDPGIDDDEKRYETSHAKEDSEDDGGWLEGDDIEEF